MSERKEVMWCVDCGARFTQEEIEGWGCPKCDSQGVPCDTDKDTTVEINWHELRILVIWAEQWARLHADKKTDRSSESMPVTVQAIARRLQLQRPEFGHLTLSGEIAALPTDLAKSGITVGLVKSNVPKPNLFEVNGPGAVGHSHPAPTNAGEEKPVAWLYEYQSETMRAWVRKCSEIEPERDRFHRNIVPLYAAPASNPQEGVMRKALEEIQEIGAHAVSNENAARMGNIAHAALIEAGPVSRAHRAKEGEQ